MCSPVVCGILVLPNRTKQIENTVLRVHQHLYMGCELGHLCCWNVHTHTTHRDAVVYFEFQVEF